MSFYSLSFIYFIAIVFVLFYSSPNKLKVITILSASYFFYIYFKPVYVLILIFVTLLNYFSGILISKSKSSGKRNLIFIISILLNLALLFVFKYTGSLSDLINSVIHFSGLKYTFPAIKNIIMPVGLSFYVFIAMGYTIDVFRRTRDSEKNIVTFSAFVSFFPTILAGPIERSTRLLPQFRKDTSFNYSDASDGLKLIAFGMFKKFVIADRMAVLVNAVYDTPQKFEGIVLLLATIAFAYQIYCDFSGYSDMAVGVARLFGYKIINNFNKPYYSKSISEFWRKWHISLSEWLRDYLFLPVAYSVARRHTKLKIKFIKAENLSYYIATFITMGLIGLWHGFSWNYLIWGLLFALFMIFSRATLKIRKRILKYSGISWQSNALNNIRVIFTFALVCFAWIFFRAIDLKDAYYVVINSFTGLFPTLNFSYIMNIPELIGINYMNIFVCIFLIVILEIIQLLDNKKSIYIRVSEKPLIFRWSVYTIAVIFLIFFGISGKAEFLYFQF
jgi:alginate O-acetyltransferase complex protein AlgI